MNRFFLYIALTFCLVPLAGMGQDTVKRHVLQEMQVSTQAPPSETYTSTPTQVVTVEKMEQTGAVQLSDAVKQMNGVTIKDYGGVGGIKTMSARGLGSQFSSLIIDGVTVNDCQNGQIDLGRYLLGNSAYVSFSNAQHDAPLQSARAFAAGNVVMMETQTPSFKEGRPFNLKVGMEGGSFHLYSPTLSWEQRITKRLSYSLWGNYITSRGNYPFTLYYTTSQQDSSSRERRENSSMWMATADANIFFNISSRHELTAKVHYMQSRHELPGPVILYYKKNSEHSEDRLFFAQARYRYTGAKVKAQAIVKYQLTDDLYEDTAAASRTLNTYRQQEAYASGTAVYSPVEGLKLSVAEDAAYNTLVSNLAKNNHVMRLSSLTVVAATYDNSWLSVSANGLATIAEEMAVSSQQSSVSGQRFRQSYRRISPYVGLNVKPFRKVGLRLRYFFKENYRIPNFNEMYYYSITRELKPEKAMQHNVGVTYILRLPESDRQKNVDIRLQIATDAYYNRVSDKLIAIPVQNMFLWSMINLGRVDIWGVDHRLDFSIRIKRITITIGRSYAYQHATDRTDPTSKTYGHQIPYTPRHSGGASLYVETPWVDFGYTAMAVGSRYYRQQNTDDTRLKPYCDQGLTLAHTFEFKNGSKLKLKGQVLNLFDVQYEIVRSYPMMGRNYRLGAVWEL
ncbi:MAG: TonB-dependent receptor [Bacteroidales bacterium]|nr:TonB-dependent receptor [Bacteroidales bacterium]